MKRILFSLVIFMGLSGVITAQVFSFECVGDYISGADCPECTGQTTARLFNGLRIKKSGAQFRNIDCPFIVKVQGNNLVFQEIINPNPETVTINLLSSGFSTISGFRDSTACMCARQDSSWIGGGADTTHFVNTSAATTHTLSLTPVPTGGSLQLAEGSGITLTTTGTALDGVVTIATTGAGANYQLWRDDGIDQTVRANANFLQSVDINLILADDAGNTETEVSADILPNAVDYAEIQQVAASSILGNPTGAPANVSEITLGTGLSFVGTVLTPADASATNEAWTIDADAGDTEVISNQTVLFDGAGINTTSYDAGTNTLTITGTEVDGSITNEIETFASTSDATSHTVTLAPGSTSVQLIEGANVTLTTGGTGANGTVTIAAAAEVDGSITNEGILGVAAGGANDALLTSNTSTANGVTVEGGEGILISESTSANGGTINIRTTRDTLYVVLSGQSNAWGATPAFQGDTTSRADVQAWDGAAWVRAEIGNEPFRTPANNPSSASYDNSNCLGLHFCKKLAEETGKRVRLILNVFDGNAIANWIPASDANYVDLQTQIAAAGVDKVDIFLWHQGEADNAQTAAYYTLKFDTLKMQLRAETWFPTTTPIVVGGLLPGGTQSNQTATLEAFDFDTDVWVGYATPEDLRNNGIDNLHFHGTSLDTLGRIRYWQAYLGLPKRNSERGAAASLNYWTKTGSELHYADGDVYLDNNTQSFGVGVNPSGNDRIEVSMSSATNTNSILQGINTNSAGITALNLQSHDAADGIFLGYSNSAASLFGGNIGFLNTYGNRPFTLATNSVNRMHITGTGNVGIGTTTPANKLDIEGGAVIGATYSGTNTAPTNGLLVEGSIGVGKTSAAHKVDIEINTSGTTAYVLQAKNSSASGITMSNYLSSTASTGMLFGYINPSQAFLGGDAGFFNVYPAKPLIFATNSVNRMHITGTGNVGIGTTTPANKLDIEGGAVIGATYSGTNTAPTNGLLVQGNVGIGTTSTSNALDVVGTAKVTGTTNFVLTAESSSTTGTTFNVKNTSAGGGDFTFSTVGSANVYPAGSFIGYDNNAAQTRYWIDPSGNFGVTNDFTIPRKFYIEGDVRITDLDTDAATRIVGADADGDLDALALTDELAITAGTLGTNFSTTISPAELTAGTTSNWNPTGLSTAWIIRLSGDDGFEVLTGITAPSFNKRLTLINVGANSVLLTNEDVLSSAANRFTFGRDVVLFPGKAVEIMYDVTSSRWRLLSKAGIYDDVEHLYFNTTFNAAVSGTPGDYDFWDMVSESGVTGVASVAGRMSGLSVNTGSSASGVGYIGSKDQYFTNNNSTGTATWAYYKAKIRTPDALSDGSNDYTIYFGFVADATDPTNDGIIIDYNHSTVSGNWGCATTNSGNTQRNDSGIAVAASTVYTLEVVFRTNLLAEFYINGTRVATNDSFIPAGSGELMYVVAGIKKSIGTTQRDIDVFTEQTSIAFVK